MTKLLVALAMALALSAPLLLHRDRAPPPGLRQTLRQCMGTWQPKDPGWTWTLTWDEGIPHGNVVHRRSPDGTTVRGTWWQTRTEKGHVFLTIELDAPEPTHFGFDVPNSGNFDTATLTQASEPTTQLSRSAEDDRWR